MFTVELLLLNIDNLLALKNYKLELNFYNEHGSIEFNVESPEHTRNYRLEHKQDGVVISETQDSELRLPLQIPLGEDGTPAFFKASICQDSNLVCHGETKINGERRLFSKNNNNASESSRCTLKLFSIHPYFKQFAGRITFTKTFSKGGKTNEIISENLNGINGDSIDCKTSQHISRKSSIGLPKLDMKDSNETIEEQFSPPQEHINILPLEEEDLPKHQLQNIVSRELSSIRSGLWQQNHSDPDNLPSADAIKRLLPLYHTLATQQQQPHMKGSLEPYVPIQEPHSQATVKQLSWHNTPTQVLSNDNTEDQEVGRYKKAIQALGTDLQRLQNRVAELEHENGDLTTQLLLFGDDKKVNSSGVRQKLAEEYKERNRLQASVKDLQKRIIEKNDMEIRYLELQKAHTNQQQFLQQIQGKMRLLKTTCENQEKVITSLEIELGSNSEKKLDCETTQNKAQNETEKDKNWEDERTVMLMELDDCHMKIEVLRQEVESGALQLAMEKRNRKPMDDYNTQFALPSNCGCFHDDRENLDNVKRAFPRYSYHNNRFK